MDTNDHVLDQWLQSVSDDEAVRALTHALAVVKVRAELRAQQHRAEPILAMQVEAAPPASMAPSVVTTSTERSRTPTTLMFATPPVTLSVAQTNATAMTRRDSIEEQLLISPRSRLPMLIGVMAVGFIALIALGSLVTAVLREAPPAVAAIELAEPSRPLVTPASAAAVPVAAVELTPSPQPVAEAGPLTSAEAVKTVRRAQAAAEARQANHARIIVEPLSAAPATQKVPVVSAAPVQRSAALHEKAPAPPAAPVQNAPSPVKKTSSVDPLDARN